jgi:tRNA C32,U32 (ribose-2'-O)-methylase TrmJ
MMIIPTWRKLELEAQYQERRLAKRKKNKRSRTAEFCKKLTETYEDLLITPKRIYHSSAVCEHLRFVFDELGMAEAAVARMHRVFRRVDTADGGAGAISACQSPPRW